MDENLELLEFIYQNADMGVYSLTKLINRLNGKDNKIKKLISDQLKGYESFYKESKKLLNKCDCECKKESMMAKMSASMGISMETMKDNSDASISHLLTQGVTMGIVDLETKIKNYESSVDKKVLKLADEYLTYQKQQLEELKKFL